MLCIGDPRPMHKMTKADLSKRAETYELMQLMNKNAHPYLVKSSSRDLRL